MVSKVAVRVGGTAMAWWKGKNARRIILTLARGHLRYGRGDRKRQVFFLFWGGHYRDEICNPPPGTGGERL